MEMTLVRNRFLDSWPVINASVIASLSKALEGPDDAYRVASVSVDIDPLTFARAGADTHVHVGYFGVPGQVEAASLGVAWQTTAPFGEDRHERAWELLRNVGLPEDVLALVGFAFDPEGASGLAWQGVANTMAVGPLMTVGGASENRRLNAVVPPRRSQGAPPAGLVSPEAPPVPPAAH